MKDEAELAPQGAGGDVAEATQYEAEASEATENTEGLTEQAPAEDEAAQADAEEKERKTRSERRRESKERMAQDLADARAEAERAAGEVNRLREALAKAPPPKEVDFSSYEEYQAALTAHAAMTAMDKRRLSELEASAQARFQAFEQRRAQESQEVAQNWASQTQEGRAKYPDFDLVALQKAPIQSERAAMMVASSDHAADVAYLLGSDEQVGAQFAALDARGDVIGMARLIGRMEATVTAPKPNKVTNAPPPISPVKATGTPRQDLGKMTGPEYQAWRMAGGKL